MVRRIRDTQYRKKERPHSCEATEPDMSAWSNGIVSIRYLSFVFIKGGQRYQPGVEFLTCYTVRSGGAEQSKK